MLADSVERRILGKRLSQVLANYYRGADHPMKIRVWSAYRRWTQYARLTVPYAETGWITIDERDLLQRQILTTGAYEPEVWTALSRFAVRDEVVWDVGAHIGSFAVRALVDSRVAHVAAFEPLPAHADVLATNLSLNKGQYSLHRCALTNGCQTATLFRPPIENTGLASFLPDPTLSAEGVEVRACAADDLVFEQGVPAPTLLKIDVEGWESPVLHGATRLFRERPPKAVVFEADCDDAGGIVDGSLVDFLSTFGYTVERLGRPTAVIERRENFVAARRNLPG